MPTKITAPIKFSETSDQVSNLQSALFLLLPMLGFADYEIPNAELEEMKAGDATVKGIMILRDKYPDEYNLELLVDERMAKLINGLLDSLFVVTGRLTHIDRQGIPEYTIVIAEYDLDGITEFDKTITNADGAFSFRFMYDAAFQKADGKTNPDLLFKVFAPSGAELNIATVYKISNESETEVAKLAESTEAPIVLMNAEQEISIRIVPVEKEKRITEFERLLTLLAPFMGERNFADLKEDEKNFQISFLSKESSVEKASIEMLRYAFAEERNNPIPAWAFFELANLPLPVVEWNRKTTDELVSILKPLQPGFFIEDIQELVKKLQHYAHEKEMEEELAKLHTVSGSWVNSVLQSDEKTNKLLDLYARHEGDTAEFWKKMAEHDEFKEHVPDIQLTLQLSQFTLGNTGLVDLLKARGIRETKDLVNLGYEDWKNMAQQFPDAIPAHIVAASPEEKANIYAHELQTLVEVVFPTEVIKSKSNSEELKTFLDHNTAFDFTQHAIDSYVYSEAMKWPEGVDKERMMRELRQTQRLYSITASVEDSEILRNMGYTSAFQISKMSIEDFTQTFSGKINMDTAAAYHAKAVAVTEASAFLLTQLREMIKAGNPYAIGNISQEDNAILPPNWKNLFGEIETCECEHCRSVYSPAAYFVDLLHILLGANGGKARNEIFRRRPDLKHTKLSCEHTDTLIPYIDLVNEILETYVAQQNIGNDLAMDYAEKATNDTSLFTEEELAANPQHQKEEAQRDADDAYTKLAAAVYPLNLPFDLNLETARQFLLEQNSSRYELMQTFGDVNSDACHAEGLGLSVFEYEILAGKKNAGLPDEKEWPVDELYGSTAANLKTIRAFLDATNISYIDLIALIKTQFLNADQNIILELNAPPANLSEADKKAWEVANACNLNETFLIHADKSLLTDAELIQINRFIRLWKKMACSIEELDMLLTAVDTSATQTITPTLLNDLSTLWQYKVKQNISIEQAAVLINNIPANGDNSLYQRLFLNKTVLELDNQFEWNPSKNELKYQGLIGEHIPGMLAALRITEQELKELVEMAGLTVETGVTATPINSLSIKNISAVYRLSLFAKINNIKIHELFLLKALLPKTILNTVHDLIKNQNFIDKIKLHELNASTLAYLFTDVIEQGDTLSPKKEAIDKSKQALTEGLKKLDDDLSETKDTITPDFLHAQLTRLVREESADKILQVLFPSNYIQDTSLEPIENDDFDILLYPEPLFDTDEYNNVLNGYISAADIAMISKKVNPSERLFEFWSNIKNDWLNYLRSALIKKHIVTEFNLDAGIQEFLFPFVESIIEAQYEEVYKQLHKFLYMVKKFGLDSKELNYFQSHGSEFDGFDWNKFSIKQLQAWWRVADYCLLRNSLPESETSLISVFEAAQLNQDVTIQIIQATGYSKENVDKFLNKHSNGNFKNEILLLLLQKQVSVSESMGVDIATLTQWAMTKLSSSLAQDIKRTVKAKYDDESWINISTNVHNRLRNELRDALVSFLLHKLGMKSTNELYAYFLIDVEMDAVTKTSRLKQAIASVQLFIQRCIMNLESVNKALKMQEILPTDIDANQWNWMKNYRVWEANRKVFLYPENWLEPELRDGKSPFFRELESELLQAEVTPETVETAVQNYLYKLNDVAHLDICGTYEDTEANELHVFGRTFNNPPIYYYRKLDLKHHVWTPWDKVQLDIQGNDEGDNAGVHLIPMVWNRRLYLFWPVFTEKSDEKKRQEAKAKYERKKKEIIALDKELAKKMIDDWNIRIKNVLPQLPIPFHFYKIRDTRTTKENGKEYLIGGGWYFEYGVNYQLTKLEEKPEAPDPTPIPEFDDNEWPYWEIKMAWSEYKQKHWTPKKMSSGSLGTNNVIQVSNNLQFLIGKGDLEGFRFRPTSNDQALYIEAFYFSNAYYKVGNFKLDGCKGKMFTENTTWTNAEFYLNKYTESNFYEGYHSWAEALDLNVAGNPVNLLKQTQSPYKVFLSNKIEFISQYDSIGIFSNASKFFYQDIKRTYYAEPRREWYNDIKRGLFNKMEINIPKQIQTAIPLSKPKNTNLFDSAREFALTGDDTTGGRIIQLANDKLIRTSTALQMASQIAIHPIGVSNRKPLATNIVSDTYLVDTPSKSSTFKMDFKPFFHQYVCNLMKELNKDGVSGLLTLHNQSWNDRHISADSRGGLSIHSNFEEVYQPNEENVWKPYPAEDIDFTLTGAYGIYNWELFFHIPMLFANRLSKNQKFEEAMHWYQFIFNPGKHEADSDIRRFWQVLPLRNTPKETLEALIQQLNKPQGDPRRKELEDAIKAWRAHPFNPHLIARMRLVGYQKNVLMKYLDNLIAWADNLFRQDTIEQINQATQLYIMAAELLGDRPQKIPARGKVIAKTYQELEMAGLNAFSNALVEMETQAPFYNLEFTPSIDGTTSSILLTTVPSDYFCLPDNPKLLAYWDTVADRLFKIRHSMNIDGGERQLALYEPPIDPALLIRAFAQGIDINSILADLNAPMPYYRFGYMMQKALEICTELKSLGNALLSVLEKKDIEALAMMRTEHEKTLMFLAKGIRKLQINESQHNRNGLEKTFEVTKQRLDYYLNLISNGLNDSEKEQQSHLKESNKHGFDAQQASLVASVLHYYPNITTGITPSTSFGGSNLGSAAQAVAEGFRMNSNIFAYYANLAQINSGHERRNEEWIQQKELAEKELKQIDKQILAAKIRENIAEQELTNQEKQIDNANQVLDYMRNKFTQEELYGWIQGEISTIYFQCYQLAYDLAKKVERTYRYELGIEESNFIKYGIWDSFRKGLMSGESLYLSLKQMEKAYMDQNKREYEITKHISIAQLNPLALILLRKNGICDFEIPEVLFDLDHPGQYFRRIKSVSISLPCIAGPYTSVSAKLSLLKSKYRKNTMGADYAETKNDSRFIYNLSALQSIATSHGQNDSGIFELNFRDERYLPFENAGAISTWHLELPTELRQFDYNSLADIILHIKYTAREGGSGLKKLANNSLQTQLNEIRQRLEE